MIEFLFIQWKMNSVQRIIIFSQMIPHSHIIREKIAAQIQIIQGLTHRFRNRIAGNSGCERIDRLHRPLFDLIVLRWAENLRMLHDKLTFLIDHTPSDDNRSTAFQCIFQKRHPEPDHLQRTGQFLHIGCRHLHISPAARLDSSVNDAFDSLNLSFFQFSDTDRLFVHIIPARIIPEQITDRIYTHFLEQLFRLFSYSFQFTDSRLLIHFQ